MAEVDSAKVHKLSIAAINDKINKRRAPGELKLGILRNANGSTVVPKGAKKALTGFCPFCPADACYRQYSAARDWRRHLKSTHQKGPSQMSSANADSRASDTDKMQERQTIADDVFSIYMSRVQQNIEKNVYRNKFKNLSLVKQKGKIQYSIVCTYWPFIKVALDVNLKILKLNSILDCR